MGCGSCSTGGCSSGCGRNGGCSSGGCNKLNTFDWLSNMNSPSHTLVDSIFEVRFKNTRKGFYRNVHSLQLYTGDPVVVESDRGYDIGFLSLSGLGAELQMKKKGINKEESLIPKIYRKANENDLEMLGKVREREQGTRTRAREIISELKLDMKLSDVEFQGDNSKAIFYYIADHRVDFRELIKVLAKEFRIRVEMKQIGLRHEAGLVGGIGSCGRELCCSTWLTEFKTVSTSAARYQNLSLNPMKISGLCGRLKCCLNYELDAYLDALQDFPTIEMLDTKKGKATLQKTDIFKRKMWFSYNGETSWYPLDIDKVVQISEMNAKNQKPDNLGVEGIDFISTEEELDRKVDFVDVVGQTKTTSSPDKSSSSSKKRNNRKFSGKRKGNTSRNKKAPNGQRSSPNQSRRGANSNAESPSTRSQSRAPQKSRKPSNRKPSSNQSNDPKKSNKHSQRSKGRNKTE